MAGLSEWETMTKAHRDKMFEEMYKKDKREQAGLNAYRIWKNEKENSESAELRHKEVADLSLETLGKMEDKVCGDIISRNFIDKHIGNVTKREKYLKIRNLFVDIHHINELHHSIAINLMNDLKNKTYDETTNIMGFMNLIEEQLHIVIDQSEKNILILKKLWADSLKS